MNMSSLYLRRSTWWAKSREQGKVVRWSLRTKSKAEARQKLREYDSTPHQEALPPRLKSPMTWDEAAQDLIAYYEAFNMRNPHEAARVLRKISRYFTGWKLADMDAGAILGYVSHRRREGKAANTINVETATLRRALKLAHEYGKLGASAADSHAQARSPTQWLF
jgi:hypothetical protein